MEEGQKTNTVMAGRQAFLTEAQRGVYFECAEKPASTMYNIPFSMRLPDKTDPDRFCEAVEKTVMAHPGLFAVIRMEKDGPVMLFRESPVFVERRTVQDIAEEQLRFVRPFDLEKGPLFRFELCESPEGIYFLLDIHHIVFDGTSFYLMLQEIASVYGGGQPVYETYTLFDEPEYERQVQESQAYTKAQDFFRDRFSGEEFDSLLLPDISTGKGTPGTGVLYKKGDLTHSEVTAFAKSNGVTESTVFLSAFAYTMSVFSGSSDSYFTTVSSGRHRRREQLAHTYGMFVKTLPLHADIRDGEPVPEFLKRIQDSLYASVDNDCISFSELSREYGIDSGTSFVFQAGLISGFTLDGERVTPVLLPGNESQGDLIGMGIKTDDGYAIRLQYNHALYTDAYMESVADTVFAVVRGMLEHACLDSISLVPEKTEELYASFNRTEKPYDTARTLQDAIRETVEKQPGKTALVFKDRSYTFQEFDRITRNIAAYVAGKGLQKDDFAALLIPRNDYMVLAAWGVIRAGAAFQPLDPEYPEERLSYMVSDSRARLLIADRSLRNILSGYTGDVLYTDEIPALPDAPDFEADSMPDSAVTMIYTSGTTGKPKGCILENRNLYAFVLSHRNVMGIDADARIASYASFGFDAGVMDLVTGPVTGAALYIIPDEIRLDLDAVEQFYRENGITHGFMTTQVGRMFAERTECATLKAFLVGGEKLVPFTPKEGFDFINGYGPCETMAYICRFRVKNNDSIQPIGRPCANTKLYVTDKHRRLLPAGAAGELCISGHQVGRGYLGLPEKTEEVFVPNPFTSEPGYERMYRTGDVVRLLADGNLEYIGRRDGQVKIRGFRVELTEVEEVLRRFPGVLDAAVAAYDDPAGGKYIAAYVTGKETLDTQQIGRFIRAEKPAYMVPAVTMQIDAIPYTQNHKVNRRALPQPERGGSADRKEKPENETQQRVFDVLSEILGHEEFGISTDFMEAGLTSIGALRLNSRLSDLFDRAVKMSDLRDHANVRELAAFLEDASERTDYIPQADYPLMQNQEGIFVDSAADTDSVRYNIPALFRLSERLDPEKLARAVSDAVDLHPYMKAKLFAGPDGSIRAKRNDEEKPEVKILRTETLPPLEELLKPFDLTGGNLYRTAVYVTGDGQYLFLDVHHILSDGTSIGILLEDINRLYAGETVMPERFTGFEAALLPGDEAASETYYDGLLSGCNTESIPEACPETDTEECGYFSMDFGPVSKKIRLFAKQHGIGENAFFNALFSYTLAEFLHTDDVTYCTVYNGRNDSRFAGSFGCFVKTIPVRCAVDTDEGVLPFVRSMQRQLLDTMANDAMPFSKLCAKHHIRPELFFNYQGDSFTFDRIGNEEAEMIGIPVPAKAKLSFEVFFKNGTYSIESTYRKDSFCRAFLASFTDALKTAAEDFIRKEKLKEVSVLSEGEKAHFEKMNATERPFERLPAHAFFEQNADRFPERCAVRTEKEELSYKELEKLSNRIANALIARGVRKDEAVGLILERSVLVPAAELGILKAGGAFLPMLPSYPDDRLGFCLTDAGCRFAVSESGFLSGHAELFGKSTDCAALDILELCAYPEDGRPELPYDPDALAYCIYTSGSTGTPKGVMIEQHNLSNFVQTCALRETEENGSSILCMASVSFDMSVTEQFFSLCMGKTVYIASEEEVHNPDRLISAMERNGTDILMMTPSFARTLLGIPGSEKALSKLKSVVLGAEAFRPVLLAEFLKLNPDMLIQNGYGPTECTQVCSVKTLHEGDKITIGSPFANTKFYITDKSGNLLPRYALGELIICGEGVCRGYVNLPEKNAQTFTEIDGVRGYRSGDLVRINGDGEAEFGGRADNQVKLRGFRVELDEIETVMQAFEGVKEAVTVVRNNGTEDYLAGFYTADREIPPETLAAFLKTKLTYYMVPAALMQLSKMPLTQNGKLNKKALPEIRVQKRAGSGRQPKNALEEKVLGVFRSVLGTEECFTDDNFFEAGGTSLSASKAVMQLKSGGYALEYQDIFDHQSAEELAAYIAKKLEKENGNAEEEKAGTEDDRISAILRYNTLEYADRVERKPLGNVLLTGAAGFLGCHILKALLDMEDGQILCLMRRGVFDNPEQRLQAQLFYYFEDAHEEAFRDRIRVIEGDITDDNVSALFEGLPFDTLIHAAASVKHYANDNSIEHVNVHGTENMIGLAREKNAKMIQISTTSVPGAHTEETYRQHLKMTEDRLFVIDDMNNQYCRSKYHAELAVLDAIEEGMRGKIIRVGNLMGRHSDGEFQTNARTNAFLNGLRGFVNIGKCPLSHATDPMSFSPVDCTARAVVLLAGTNDIFTAFHAESRSTFDEMKIIEAINRCGITVRPVQDREYYDAFYKMMGDPEKNAKVSALLTNDRPDMHMVEADSRFTANILYRLGFSWPFIDDEYLEKVITSLDTLDFFFHE